MGYTGGILKKLCDTSEHQFFVYVRVSGDILKKKFGKKNHFSGFAHKKSKMAAILVKICDI